MAQLSDDCFAFGGPLLPVDEVERLIAARVVPVKEIEDVVLCHPKVRNVALVGVPDERLGEVGCVCVVLEAGEILTLDELRTFLTDRQVTRQFWPERPELMSEFPMTPSGKVQKFQLREMLARTQASASPVAA